MENTTLSKLKSLKKLTRKRIMLLIGFALSIITMLLSQTPLQTLVSSNTTIVYIEEVTRMPFWVFVGLIVLVIVICIYLWVEAGEEDNVDKLEKKIDKYFSDLIEEIKALRGDKNGNGKS